MFPHYLVDELMYTYSCQSDSSGNTPFRPGLVRLLFNGISTLVGYLMPKSSLWKNCSGIIQSITRRIREFILFPRVLAQK